MTNQGQQQYVDVQVVKIDAASSFVEVQDSFLHAKKIIFYFAKYDQNQGAGNRITDKVSCYLSVPAFLRLYYDLFDSKSLVQKIERERLVVKQKEASGQQNVFAQTLDVYQGGSKGAGGTTYRRMYLIPGKKDGSIVMVAESGPGEADAQGLIQRKYQKPEQRVFVPMEYDSLKELFMATKMAVEAYSVIEALEKRALAQKLQAQKNAQNAYGANSNY